MELHDALTQRRSCRDYEPTPVDAGALDRIIAASRRGPTAGNSWALDLLVLEGDRTAAYWDVSLPAGERRDRFAWPGLLDAPVLVLPYVRPQAYVERYARHDKAATGLGEGEHRWAVPYWWVDAGAAVMAMLLAATAEGLGSLLFGQFDHAAGIAARFGVPDDRVALGTVAIGRARSGGHRPSASARVGRPPVEHTVHRGQW